MDNGKFTMTACTPRALSQAITQIDHPKIQADAVVLAGIHQWGSCPLEQVVPRPLVPVAGMPLIAHALRWLGDAGVSKASICANSDSQYLRKSLGDGKRLGIQLDYYEDVTPRGPAGCIRDAVCHGLHDTIIAVEGTIVPCVDIAAMIEAHKSAGAVLTVAVMDRHCGLKGFDDLQPTGVYVLSRSVLKHISPTGYQDIKEGLIPALHLDGAKILTFKLDPNAIARVSGVASYLSVSQWAVETMLQQGRIPQQYDLLGEAIIHRSAEVHPDARMVGPVLIEPGCTIEADAMIVGPTTIGAFSRIEQGAVVTRSTLWRECVVGVEAVVDHSILTDRSGILAKSVVRGAVCIPPRPDAAGANLSTLTSMFDLPEQHRDLARRRVVAYVTSTDGWTRTSSTGAMPDVRIPVVASAADGDRLISTDT